MPTRFLAELLHHVSRIERAPDGLAQLAGPAGYASAIALPPCEETLEARQSRVRRRDGVAPQRTPIRAKAKHGVRDQLGDCWLRPNPHVPCACGKAADRPVSGIQSVGRT
jgi:hypothetical protein